jgi:prevent-host-death family protein
MAIMMYMKRVTVAEARNSLPALIHSAEVEPVEILRRGKPVAVLISREAFDRMPARTSFFTALQTWRAENHGAVDDEGWLPPRERSPGRKAPKW